MLNILSTILPDFAHFINTSIADDLNQEYVNYDELDKAYALDRAKRDFRYFKTGVLPSGMKLKTAKQINDYRSSGDLESFYNMAKNHYWSALQDHRSGRAQSDELADEDGFYDSGREDIFELIAELKDMNQVEKEQTFLSYYLDFYFMNTIAVWTEVAEVVDVNFARIQRIANITPTAEVNIEIGCRGQAMWEL